MPADHGELLEGAEVVAEGVPADPWLWIARRDTLLAIDSYRSVVCAGQAAKRGELGPCPGGQEAA